MRQYIPCIVRKAETSLWAKGRKGNAARGTVLGGTSSLTIPWGRDIIVQNDTFWIGKGNL